MRRQVNMTKDEKKRQQFREQIRRKHIDALFQQYRRNMSTTENGNKNMQVNIGGSMDNNEQLLRRSLCKNQLLWDIRNNNLLNSLYQKILNHQSTVQLTPNIEFVMSVLANVMLDDIQLGQKEMIFQIGAKIQQLLTKIRQGRSMGGKQQSHLKIQENIQNIIGVNGLIWINFWQAVIWNGYNCYSEHAQIFIQHSILPKLVFILQLGQNIPNWKYVMNVNEELMGSLHYFFREQKKGQDHNNILLYKTKRNIEIIQGMLKWAQKTQCMTTQATNYELKCDKNTKNENISFIKEILDLQYSTVTAFTMILKSISQLPINLDELGDIHMVHRIIMLLFQKIYEHQKRRMDYFRNINKNEGSQIVFDEEKTDNIIYLCIQVLCNLLNSLPFQENPHVSTSPTHNYQWKIQEKYCQCIVQELETQSAIIPITLKINFVTLVITSWGIHQNPLFSLCEEILSAVIRILTQFQQHSQVTIQCLICIQAILRQGYKEGVSEFKQYLKSSGGLDVLQGIQIKTKNEEISQIFASIDHYIDIC